jgi:hypothetical protein
MGLDVDVSTAVRRLNKGIDFLQPLFEAITNSLEAKATEISINFFLSEDTFPNMPKKIIGFSVEDNGEGFNKNNRESFCKYMSEYKIKLGCKGVGKLTWLRVFEKVKIESVIDNEIVKIDFDISFDKSKSVEISDNFKKIKNRTSVFFEDITSEYYNVAKKKDYRPEADLTKIYDVVEKHLLVKLSLLKKYGEKFSINLNLDGQSFQITDSNIPELFEKEFIVKEKYADSLHKFCLHYSFIKNGQKQKYLYYCANNRSVCQFKDIDISSLPHDDSLIMLLSSTYLDDRVIDERNEFEIPKDRKKTDLINSLSFDEINEELKNEAQSVIFDIYPEIGEINESEIENAIREAPYLGKYIRSNKDIIKSRETLLSGAKKEYEKEKNDARTNFTTLLKTNKIDSDNFVESAKRISDIAARELGEYIQYRQQIIDALKKLSEKDEAVEELVHDLFMKMKSESTSDIDNLSIYNSNLWLLDDKFLSYSYAASDKKINAILKQQGLDKANKDGEKAPDLAVFYSNGEDDDNLTCVLIEIKPFGISSEKKHNGLAQLRNYANIFHRNNPKIKAFWVYLITKIDDDLGDKLRREEYNPIFSTTEGHKIFVRYFPKEEPPMYLEVICVDAIVKDAESRNKIFLDILKDY